jgi:hypothetical protein
VTRRWVNIVVIAAAAAAAGELYAATIRDVTMDHDGARYRLTSSTYMDAPREAVFRVLTDYERFDRISSVYAESRFLPPDDDGTTLVYTRVEGCVLFFCKSLVRVERMETEEPALIRTTADPARSDFRYARSEWHLEPESRGTHVVYEMELEPAFWVPPVIGPWIIKRRLLRDGVDAVARIEGLAQQLVVGQSATAP